MNKVLTNVMGKQKFQSGQMLILVIVVLFLIIANALILLAGSLTFLGNSKYALEADQSVNLAEAGVDKALASLNASGGSYNGETETFLDKGSYSVSVTTPNSTTKTIEATGYVPSKQNPTSKRTVKVTLSKGIGLAFNYGIQVGEGGLEMANESRVNGSVYSNGNILMDNNARITGDAYVAGGVAPTADQFSSCIDPTCIDFIFGKNISGNDILDVAQSFKPSTESYLSKIKIKIKKYGNPSDIVVRLMGDNGEKPDKGNILASGTLTANLVTSQYGDIEVNFTSSPLLSADDTYWIVLDTSSNSNNFWSWSADSNRGYLRGEAKWSEDWGDNHPTWNSSNNDLNFQIFLGGLPTNIQGSNGARIGGDAHAHRLADLIVSKGAYYQQISNVTADSLHPNSPDPVSQTMPISESNLATWKSAAEEAGVYSEDISGCQATLGPSKYNGNVTFANNCTVTIIDPVWITGSLTLNNGITLKLDPTKGSSSGVIIIDGKTILSNTVNLQGTGVPGSYLMLVSGYDSRTNGEDAIAVNNTGIQGVLYAPNGIINISNNNHLTELTAWKIKMSNGVVVDYDSGLASTFFSSGPSGMYSVVKGSYQIK